MLVLAGAFAYVVVSSQSESRREAQRRFDSEASLSAQLTSTLFSTSLAGSEAAAAKAYGAQTIDPSSLAKAAATSKFSYLVILDQTGKVLAASPGAPSHFDTTSPSSPVREALEGHAWLSSAAATSGGSKTTSLLEYAVPFTTPFGRRVAIEASDGTAVFAFLSSYLTKTQTAGNGAAFVLDNNLRIVADAGVTGLKFGSYPKAATLIAALKKKTHGTYGYSGAKRYFSSSPVDGTTWRVVLSVPTNTLYPALAGSRGWLLYLVLAGFALVGLTSVWFFRRALATGVALEQTNNELTRVNATLEERVAERSAAAEERAKELARSNEELEQFSSVASHDLQEPLRKIRMFGERLRDRLGDSLAEEPAADLERMSNAAARMQQLISDLLDFSRVTHRGKEFEAVDLGQVTRDVVADLEARVVELDAQIELGELPTIEADKTQMRQLMQNLVGNALKFHREGEPPVVRIHADVFPEQAPRFAAEATAAERCIITVEDNGIGFDEKHAERVFTAFERLHARSSYEGTGIGLSIARKIVWRHGGHITAAGVPGVGATFTVTLPLSQPNGRNGGAAQ
ncbi:MAG TPA: ATP-binding protein [Gaiellaceae bacterium]|nr:ATP-binding protein [Gaiellaceae bacterium]